MTERSPQDGPPELPSLRRFRFDPDGSGIAREVSADGTDDPGFPSAESSTEAVAASSAAYDDHPDLAQPRRSASQGIPAAPRESEPVIGSTPVPPAPQMTSASVSGSPTAESSAPTGGSTAVKYIETSEKMLTPHKSRIWIVVAALAVKAILGVGLWWAIEAAGEPENSKSANTSSAQSEDTDAGSRPSDAGSDAATWAGQMCTAMITYNTEATELRTKLSALTSSGNASSAVVTDLAQDAEDSLDDLADDLTDISAPSGPAQELHDQLETAATSASAAAKSAALTGNTQDRLAKIQQAMDQPGTVLQTAVAQADPQITEALGEAPACRPLGI